MIMELRYAGIFSGGDNSGLYQRLAVGSGAVKQPGASVMFARDNSGQLDTKTAEVLAALKSAETPAPLLDAKYKLTACYNSPEGKRRIDGILTNQSWRNT